VRGRVVGLDDACVYRHRRIVSFNDSVEQIAGLRFGSRRAVIYRCERSARAVNQLPAVVVGVALRVNGSKIGIKKLSARSAYRSREGERVARAGVVKQDGRRVSVRADFLNWKIITRVKDRKSDIDGNRKCQSCAILISPDLPDISLGVLEHPITRAHAIQSGLVSCARRRA
jgi:hypothetical protein